MKIYVEKEKKNLEIDSKNAKDGRELLEQLKINPATIILVKNNEVVLEDEVLEDTDEIKILSVISGG